MNLYYRIWADCLITMKKKDSNWKINSLILMSTLSTLNLLLFFIVLLIFNKLLFGTEASKLPKIPFIDFFFWIFLIFILSFLTHYMIVFSSKKYLEIQKKENRDKTVGLISKYFVFSLVALLLSYLLGKLLL